MCPSYLATRDEKDSTRGRARVLQELANGSLVHGLPRAGAAPTRSTCACRARAARPTARRASTWRPTSPRCCTSATGAGCARRRTTRSAGCRGGPGSRPARRGSSTRRCAATALAALAKRARRHRRAAAAAAVRAADLPRVVRRRTRGRPAPPVCCGWTPSPITSHPRSARRRCACCRRPGTTCSITDKPVCCGLTWISTGQLDGARRQLERTLTRSTGALRLGIPIVGLEPSCTAVLRHDAGGAAARRPAGGARSPRPPARWPSCSPHAGLDAAGPGRHQAVAQPHCHQHAVMGFRPDASCSRRPAPTSRPSAAAAGWPATSAWSAGTTRCRARSPRPRCCRRCAPHRTTRSSSPTASPAAPRSSSSAQVHWRPPRADCSTVTVAHRRATRRATPARAAPCGRTGFVPPPYPYERLGRGYRDRARHEGGAVDLSIGTPCDPPPPARPRRALGRRHRPRLSALDRHEGAARRGCAGGSSAGSARSVDPATELAACVGTKEFVASVPQYLKLRDPGATPSCSRRSAIRPTRWARRSPAARRAYLALDEIADADAERALASG